MTNKHFINAASQFELILDKLHKTFTVFKPNFQELILVENEVSKILNHNSVQSNLEILNTICQILQDRTVQSYVVRHLYNNFCTDVEAFRNGNLRADGYEYYIELPNH